MRGIRAPHPTRKRYDAALAWFIVWLVLNLVGDSESLTFDPVNGWTGTLFLALALDLVR